MKNNFIFIIILLVVAFLLWKFFFSKLKVPKLSAITLFTGGVKTGKSAVSLHFAITTYKRVHFEWRIKCFFAKLFKKELPEEPLLYSTIPIANVPFCLIHREHFLREIRFNYKSVIFIDEASLIADSMLIKDNKINTRLLLFFKLFGHETHGGHCIINSHCITDLHFAIKRTTSTYFYIHSLDNYPFICLANMREERYSDDGTNLNVYNNDVEDTLKRVLIFKSIFKKYDTFAFSYLTDDLPVYNDKLTLTKYDSLKANTIPSFRDEIYFNSIRSKESEKENI